MKIKIILLFILVLRYSSFSQPGPYGGTTCNFSIFDSQLNRVITPNDTSYKIFGRILKPNSEGIIFPYTILNFDYQNLNFSKEKNSFIYEVKSTPMGGRLPKYFSIYIIKNSDTMKILNIGFANNDTILFEKGNFKPWYIEEENRNKLNYYDKFRFQKLDEINMKFINIDTVNRTELKNKYINGFLKELPDNIFIGYDITFYRHIKGNYLDPQLARNSGGSSYSGEDINTTTYRDTGINYYYIDKDSSYQNYEFEKIDNFLSTLNNDFGFHSNQAYRNLFNNKLDWNNTNAITFAILSNLQFTKNGQWIFELNHKEKSRVFISNDKGESWHKIFSCDSCIDRQIKITEKNLIYISQNKKLLRSNDGGISWKNLLSDSFQYNIRAFEVYNDTIVFIITNSNYENLLKYNLQSNKWVFVPKNINCCYYDRILRRYMTGGLIAHKNKLILGQSDIQVSTNLGNNWHQFYTNHRAQYIIDTTLINIIEGKIYKHPIVTNIHKNWENLTQIDNNIIQVERLLKTTNNQLILFYTFRTRPLSRNSKIFMSEVNFDSE